MIVRPPYDVSMFESAGVSVLCCILFYTFEVPSQLKISSFTLLVHEFPKIHADHTTTLRSPYGSCKGRLLYTCDFYAWLQRQHDNRTISVISPHGLFVALHRSIVETRQSNRTMTV